jgi:hypothetical protein
MMPLDSILNYHNPAVIERYNFDYPNNTLSASEALKHVGRYLWICKKHQQDRLEYPNNKKFDFDCAIHPEMQEIDDMWHTFILFTEDYMDYCNVYFGHYMHHRPTTSMDIKSTSTKEDKIQFERYLSYIYDNLGDETLRVWFAEYFKE